MESKEKTMDLTTGHPLKQILIFSIPLVFGTIFQQLYSLADTVIVGRCLGQMLWRRWGLHPLSIFSY